MTESRAPASPSAYLEHDRKRRVAQAFGRVAPHYVDRASAQHAMGERLWRRLPAHAMRIVDLGCGPGHWTARLARHYAHVRGLQTWGLDIAPGMLAEARRRHGERCHWLCADAEALPLAADSIDLMFSNLAIQWCRHPERLMAELRRVMTPGATALINTLGPGSLHELRHAWQREADPDAIAASTFADVATLERAMRLAGFRRVRVERAHERYFYPDLQAVNASVKGVGAQLPRPGARLTRRDLALAGERYERLRTPEGLPVTYCRLTLELVK
ncbi:malonyl-ACP O-methyltransferase BioC [Halomonas shantousis]